MRRWCPGFLFLPLVLVLAAGCGTQSSAVIDGAQLAACQVTAGDLAFPAQPVPAFPTTPGLSGQTLTIGGSTALYPLFQATATAFDQVNGTHTRVQQGGSVTGLRDVEAGTVQIGMSDLFFDDNATTTGDTDLVDHRVAAVAFTLVVNQDLRGRIHNLTMRQIQAIYNGTAINWQELGGPNELITVVARPGTSGTRATFEHFVLGGSREQAINEHLVTRDSSDLVAQTIAAIPGSIGYLATGYVINPKYQGSIAPVCIDGQPPTETSINAGAYRFWNYEHAYTKGAPSPVARAFLTAVTSDVVQASLVPAQGFLRIDQLSAAAQATHPLPAGTQ